MVNQATRNFLIGLTTIAAAVGFAALLMLFGELDELLDAVHSQMNLEALAEQEAT